MSDNRHDPDELRKRLFDDLQRRVNDELGLRKWEMYHSGIWCGYMNTLTPESPRCVQSENEMFEWYGRAIDYLQRWKLHAEEKRHGS